ncbi:MAG: hypothetical protein JWQ38_412 [Flavipsychrobacter sp.]|nr:hypothetical protein [Flavipsychrobacter sp.]
MKSLYRIVLLLLVSFTARAQYVSIAGVPVIFDAATPSACGITITTVGTGAFTTGGGGSCFPAGGVNSWWIGGGGVGSYLHTFNKPIYKMMIPDWALNGGPTPATSEWKSFSINGAPYPISPSEMISGFTTCPSTGPACYVLGGIVYGPCCSGGQYGGDTIVIESCEPIWSIEMYCGNCGSGDVYELLLDTTKPASCQNAVANTPCVLDTLFLGYVGDSTGATYGWSGPKGYTSTGQFTYIYPASFSDTGRYIASRTKLGVTIYDTVYVSVNHCSTASANDPCEGFPLWLYVSGDSAGVSYKWKGPKGFSSTLHHPFKNPAVLSDTGMYYVYRSIGGISDTDSVHVTVHPRLNIALSNNAPMCANTLDTLRLSSTPVSAGMTYAWSGPNGFTSTLQLPEIDNFTPSDTGFFKLIAADQFGCKDTAQIHAGLVMPPDAPKISGPVLYCQYDPVGVYTGTDTTHIGGGGVVLWDTKPIVGYGTPAATVTTAVPGTQTIYAYVTNSFGCKSVMSSYKITVNPKPPVPGISGGVLNYCEGIGPYTTVNVSAIPGAAIHWWKTFMVGTPTATQPLVDITIPGVYTFYVSQNDNGCESDAATVVITVHPKPKPPKIKSDSICQFWPAAAMTATPSTPGDLIRWFIAPDTIGNIVAPVPVTLVPGLYEFFANELSPFGCLSDKSKGTMYVKPKPAPPIPHDTTYCQFTKAPQLTADSVYGGYLKWYYQGNPLPHAPVPSNAMPGDSTWFVSEVINGCESDSLPMKVTTIYKPLFSIEPSSPFVCQFDSVKFSYKGPSLFDPAYAWSIPQKSVFAHGPEGEMKTATDSFIYVRFDSVTADNYIRLHVTNNHGFCAGDTSYRIKIVPQPYAKASTKGDVCQGDTVSLALGTRGSSAEIFLWNIDNVPMDQTNALAVVAHNSNSGGPFSISWNDSGRHVIQVISSSKEGCKSLPTEDTISVHSSPDARFTYMSPKGTLCLEDSVQFTAMADNYNYSYVWAPEHFFSNVNKRQIYGKVELSQSTVTLLVTDPYGCYATTSQTLNPGSCCTVGFPTAFLPNGGNKNTIFRPVYQGYHRFSIFRVANRWGQTVFESTNNGMSWDGTFNGVPQDAGVYFYYIKYDCGGKSLEQTGNVTLIR